MDAPGRQAETHGRRGSRVRMWHGVCMARGCWRPGRPWVDRYGCRRVVRCRRHQEAVLMVRAVLEAAREHLRE